MKYDFLIETYETERIKTLSVWSMFKDEDLPGTPSSWRSVHEQMVHQCVSEDLWFRTMLGIDVHAPPLPEQETRLEFIKRYAEDSEKRLAVLQEKDEIWWEEETQYFDVNYLRAWVVVRRMTHTAHHRGQLTAMLRMLGRELHSTYGPTGGYRGLNAKSRPNDICISRPGGTHRRRNRRRSQGPVAGSWREIAHRKT